ncbi:MAG: type II toxin-antitoxin system RelE/ParE family toxin [Armatimonadetes bacterium]|nr:type II toxin-antitoxin system RelE/ParE family toxin [Armatimonadota bacterium]
MHEVSFTRSAQKGLEALPRDVQVRIAGRIDALSEDPRPSGSQPLKGHFAGLRKLRVGDYRVVYHVDDESRTVCVLRVGHRRHVYD